MHKTTDSTIFTTRLYNYLLIEKSTCIYYWTPPSWFHAVNCVKTASQGLIQTGFGFANGMKNPMNRKLISVLVCQMEYTLDLSIFQYGTLTERLLLYSRKINHRKSQTFYNLNVEYMDTYSLMY